MPEPSSAKPRRHHWIIAGSLAGAVALAACWLFMYAAPAAREGIRVEPRWFRCNGDEVPFKIVNRDDELSDPYPAFIVDPKTEDLCQMQFTIINDGNRAVHIRHLEFPSMAPAEGGGFPLELTENGGDFAPVAGAEGYASSIEVDVDEDLAGDGASFDELVDIRPRGAVGTGKIQASTTMRGLPRVHLSFLGVRGSIEGSINLKVQVRD